MSHHASYRCLATAVLCLIAVIGCAETPDLVHPTTVGVLPPATELPQVSPTPDLFFPQIIVSDTLTSATTSTLLSSITPGVSTRFTADGYHLRVDTPQMLVWSALPTLYGDCGLGVEAALVSDVPESAYGLLFRLQDEQNYVVWLLTGNGYYALDRQRNGRWETLIDWTHEPTIYTDGRMNRMRVDMAGTRLRLFLNGALLAEASDTVAAEGRVAVAVQTFAKGKVTARFRSLQVSQRRGIQP